MQGKPATRTHPLLLYSLQKFVPTAIEAGAEPGDDVDAGLFATGFNGLKVAVADLSTLGKVFLGELLERAQLDDVLAQDLVRVVHSLSVPLPGIRNTIFRSYSCCFCQAALIGSRLTQLPDGEATGAVFKKSYVQHLQ